MPPPFKRYLNMIDPTITATMATPDAIAILEAMTTAMRSIDTMPTSTAHERTIQADAIDRFMALCDTYDVLVYGSGIA